MKVLILLIIVISRGESLENDEELENSFNCKCVLNENCYNGYLNTEGVGIIVMRNDVDGTQKKVENDPIQCSNSSYICCKDRTTITKNVATFSPIKPSSPTTTEESKSKNEECGKQKPFINMRVKNRPSDFSSTIDGEFPWLVSIHIKDTPSNDGVFKFKCAGTLITDRVVLTAAHCVKSFRQKITSLKILGNALSELKKIGEDTFHERDVKKIVVHPEYYAGGPHNDIALIFVESSFNNILELNTICLPTSKFNHSTEKCLAAGWGAGNEMRVLKKVQLPLIEFENCEKMLRETKKLGDDFKLHESFICAGGVQGKDTCKGDGGGPLMCPDEYGFLYQVGIVSWGLGCAQQNHPGMYTDLAKFHDWINENIEDSSTFNEDEKIV